MTMTAGEIVTSYRQARDRAKQIGVLAKLNATDRESIRAVLIDAGELRPDPPERSKKRVAGGRYKNQAEMQAAIRALLAEGKSDKEIAETVRCAPETVRNHRKKMRDEQAEPKPPAPGEAAAPEAGDAGHEQEVVQALGYSLTLIIAGMPEDAADATKLKCYELCKAMVERIIARAEQKPV